MAETAPRSNSGQPGRRAPRVRGPVPAEDRIYNSIVKGIVTKAIRPGARLKEAVLASQYGVSRARVRRVLRRLLELSVLEFKFNLGAVVCRPSVEEARSVFRIRRVLELEAVRAAAAVRDHRALAALRSSLVEEEEAFAARSPGVVALASRFHVLLAEATGNPVLARILVQLVHQCVLIQALYEREVQHTVCLVSEHAALVDQIEAGDAAAASRTMAEHLDHIEESIDLAREPVLKEASDRDRLPGLSDPV